MSGSTATPSYKRGIVKQITSGDTIVIRKNPTTGPPPEKILVLSGVTAPRLARQKTSNNDEIKEEPYAWEAREFLRKLLIGKEVIFTSEKPANSTVREYGCVWAGLDPNTNLNVTEALVAEGLVKVRDGSRNMPHFKKLVDLEESAKAQGKGIWGKDLKKHVRDVKWSMENMKDYVTRMNGQPIKAIVEYVRDGSTVRLCLLPEFQQITMMISGIRCPQIKQDGTIEPYAEEARYIVESHLLQNEVEVILEGVNNNNFVGTLLHPQGNIAEMLLKCGVAKCVDWSLALMASGVSTLRAAERTAKEQKRRIWANYISNAPIIAAKDKEFTCTVMEVLNSDALVVKMNNNQTKKIFLASIRQPQRPATGTDEDKNTPRGKNFRPLYDVPWMFEAREFLRKRLIGRKVNVTVDYIQPAKDNLPEKTCCTVIVGGTNIAEALISAGYSTAVRYRNDNDQRSSHYDALMDAELKANKAGLGVHSKKEKAVLRIQDTSADAAKSRKFLPFLKRAQKADAIVEFVASGSRMRLYLPKESVIVTFLLAGISCPRGARPSTGNAPAQKAEPYGEEALQFTKEKCLLHDVQVTVEDMDKAGNFIGWLWIENENLSILLVENGLAAMHHTAETSEYARQIKTAEESAKAKGIGIWKDFVETEKEKKKVEKTNTVAERVVNYETVIITEITPEGSFFAQNVAAGPKLEALMNTLRQELETNAPLPGAFMPKKGSLCAARFSLDKQWYRAKIEKVFDNTKVQIFYYDYGNREIVNDVSRLAALPSGIEEDPPYATEYVLSCVKFPKDADDKKDAIHAFSEDTLNKKLNLNIETKGAPSTVTLVDPATNTDLGKNLIKTGLLLMENSKDRRLQSLISEYRVAQDHAKNSRLNLWRYGDITDDDDVEFGGRR